jgi:hypothetical protein
MKNIFFKATPYLALFLSSFIQAQETKTVTTVNNKSASKYNYHDSLDPIFYTKTAQNPDQQAVSLGQNIGRTKQTIN